jgi:4-carboxymuconolactone decarboxylase
MTREALEKGMQTRRKVLGDDWVDLALKNTTPFNAEFQDLITRYAWNEIWNRTGLTHRERRLIVIGTMVGLGKWEEFRLHVRAALESKDLSIDDVKEVLLQQAIYCGVPAGNTAFREARAVVEEYSGAGRRKHPR